METYKTIQVTSKRRQQSSKQYKRNQETGITIIKQIPQLEHKQIKEPTALYGPGSSSFYLLHQLPRQSHPVLRTKSQISTSS